MKLASLLLIPALVLPAPAADGAARLDEVIAAVGSKADAERAMLYMRGVHANDRWFTFPKFEETARYVSGALRDAGIPDVEIVRPPADGETQYGFWTMPLAWDVSEARLEVLEPPAPENLRVLADYREAPASLIMWSAGTPKDGLTAEVIDVGSADADELRAMDIEGKLVLISGNPTGLKWLVSEKGAAGVLNGFTENPELRDDRQWVNSWGDRGWGLTKDDSRLPGFSLTPAQTAWIREQLAAGRKVRLRATIDSRLYAGSYPYTTAVIPGTDRGEEVLALGHSSEPGAQDNATGVAAMIEALHALHDLIESGRLPRPKRGIRMMAMAELYGTHHYVATNPERIRGTIAALCLDTPAASYGLAGTSYTFHLNPDVASSFVDAFTMRLAERYFSKLDPPRPFDERPYAMGTDTFLSEPMIGIPTVWPYSGSGVHTHHNSADTPDDVDPRSLRDLVRVTAAYLYYLASAGPDDAGWLTELTLSRACSRTLAATARGLDQISAARGAHQVGRALHDGLEAIDYRVEREAEAVRSVRRIAPGYDTGPTVGRLQEFGQRQAERLSAAARQRARATGLSGAIAAIAPEPDPMLSEAASIIVTRKRFGTIPLDDVAVNEREGWPSGAWNVRLATALYWCDGQRPLSEAVRLTRLELGPDHFDYTGYFRFLAARGYVTLRTLW